jgi:hypothetical protein
VLRLICVTALAILPVTPHNASMARPGRKPKTLDPNQFAAAILEAVTGEPVGPAPKEETGPAKDPAAVALGRKGGLKGGGEEARQEEAEANRQGDGRGTMEEEDQEIKVTRPFFASVPHFFSVA